MSNKVERRIVQMVFEANEFRKGIRQSIDDLGALKKSFQMDEAQRSLSELEKATHVDFSPMSNALDSINNKMSIVGVAAAAMVTKITGAIMGAASKLADALIVAPIVTGLEEYEIQLNAIQTILANTAKHGTDLKDVSGALDELNTYADLTIYNFTQMVDSIGKFTTAGVDLETSVLAIKGIANIAAISGSSAQQASTAMYQLSQAIGTGSLKLQDWNSVVNAGMGGQIFQDALADTARTYGVNVDAIIEKNGSFRASLQEGWISKEILLDTLAKFTGDLSDAELEALGYTSEQIAAIQEQAQMAVDAATKIKTLTGLMDTLNEALQSGWAQSWKFIFGDFYQAQILWGRVSEFFSEMIAQSSDSRNQLLGDWSALGGRTKAIDGFFNLLHAGKNILTAVGEAFREIFDGNVLVTVLRMTRLFRDWTERVREGSENLDGFKTIMKAVASIFSIVFMVIQAVLKPFGLLQGITSGLGGGFLDMLVTVSEAIIKFRDMAEETDFFDKVVTSIIEHTKEFVAWVKDLVQQFKDLEIVERVVATVLWVFEKINKIDPAKVWQGFLDVLKAIVAPFYLAAKGAQWLYEELVKLEVVQDIIAWFNDIDLNEIKAEFVAAGEGVKEFIEEFKGSDFVVKMTEFLNTFDGHRIKEFFEAGKDSYSGIGATLGKIKDALSDLLPDMDYFKEAAGKIGESLGDAFSHLFDYITGDASELDYDRLFKFINVGLAGGFIIALRELADMFSLDTIFGDTDIGEGIADTLDGISGSLDAMALNIKSDALKNVAIAIALLAGSIFLLSAIPSERLKEATLAISLMTLGLVGAVTQMGGLNMKEAAASALAMVGLGLSLGLVAQALKPVSEIKPERLLESTAALGGALLGLVTSVIAITKLAGSQTKVLAIVAIMYAISKSLASLSNVIKVFGEMEPEVLTQGGIAVGVAMTALTGAMVSMSRFGDKEGQKIGVSMIALAAGLYVLTYAIQRAGEMDPTTIINGLTVIGAALGGFAVFSNFLKPEGLIKAGIALAIMSGSLFILFEAIKKFATFGFEEFAIGMAAIGAALIVMVFTANAMTGAMQGALAIAVMAGALWLLSEVFLRMQDLEWEDVALGMVVIAGTLAILTVAGYLMAPIIPVLIGLGIAMALIGIGAFLMGLGLLLAATGLVAIAGSAALIAKAIPVVGDAIIEILPRLAGAFAEAIVSFITVLAEKGPELFTAFSGLIVGMLESITSPDFLPKIAGMVLGFITAMIDEFEKSGIVDKVIQAGWDVLISLIKGVEDNIQEVVDAGLGVIEEFIKGLEEALPDVLVQANKTLIAFLETIEEDIASEENIARIVRIGVNIAGNILAGITRGLIDGAGDVIDQFGDIIDDVFNRGEEKAEEDSPSKRSMRMASYLIDGLVIGFKTNMYKAVRAMDEFGTVIKRNLEPVVQQMADHIEKQAIFEPVISPVLDLNKIRRSDIEKMLSPARSYNIAAAIASTGYGSGGYTDDVGVSKTTAASGVVFQQYNYSPKALDRETIYRQTRTQVAKLEEERAFR